MITKTITTLLTAGFVTAAMTAGASADINFNKLYSWTGSIPIPDSPGGGVPGAAVHASINVQDVGTIDQMMVGIRVSHTWQGDLRIWLEHVDSGKEIMLINRPGRFDGSAFGFSSDNFGNPATGEQMLFNDAGAGTYNRAERGGIVVTFPQVLYQGLC